MALTALEARAAALWRTEYLQREWLRAIAVVRATRKGWLLERRASCP